VAFQQEETDGKPTRVGLAVFLAAAFIAAVRLGQSGEPVTVSEAGLHTKRFSGAGETAVG